MLETIGSGLKLYITIYFFIFYFTLRILVYVLFFSSVPAYIPLFFIGTIVVVIAWYLDIQLHVQSVPITTKVVSSNPVHGEVYSIQCYVIKFVSDLRQVGGFLRLLRFPPCYMYLTCFVPHMYLSCCVPEMYLSYCVRQV